MSGCPPDLRVEVFREGMIEQALEARAWKEKAEKESQARLVVEAKLRRLRRRLGPFADDDRGVEDLVLELLDEALEQTVADWHERAPHGVAARRMRTNLRLKVRAAFADNEDDDADERSSDE